MAQRGDIVHRELIECTKPDRYQEKLDAIIAKWQQTGQYGVDVKPFVCPMGPYVAYGAEVLIRQR